jgi:hypothetical protein
MTQESGDPDRFVITTELIAVFEKTEAQVEGFFEEIGNICKKKPDDALNVFKIGFINQVLLKANQLLGDEYRPFPDFTSFDVEGSIPTASDVVVMLSQYLKVMDEYRSDRTRRLASGVYLWNTKKGSPSVEAKPPKKFAR